MPKKDAAMTIRLTTEDREALERIARENDESVGQVIRRAIRLLIAGSAALLVLLGLSACGSAEPAAAPSAPVVEQTEATPEPAGSEPATETTSAPKADRDCVTVEQVRDFNASFRGLDSADEFQHVIDLLATMTPCGEQARLAVADYTESAEINRDGYR